eukprot:5932078-Amphidinium_carterae.1
MSGVVVDKFPTTVPGLELPEGKAPRIAYVSVEPGMQRQGLATKLVRCCEDWAAARGETEMWVFVDNANTRAYNLYKKLGYIPVKEDISTQLPTAGQGVHEARFQSETPKAIATMPIARVAIRNVHLKLERLSSLLDWHCHQASEVATGRGPRPLLAPDPRWPPLPHLVPAADHVEVG